MRFRLGRLRYLEMRSWSWQSEVIIEDATQHFTFLDESFGQWLLSFNGRLLVKTLMGTALVVIGEEFVQNSSQMSFIQDQ